MKVKNIAEIINELVPIKSAQVWDNVGLLIGDEKTNVKNILLTIDITKEVLDEAKKMKAELILSYHPIIWDGLKKITADGESAIVYNLIKSGISVFSIHTAFDVISGGVNDGLAEIVGIENAEPIGDYVENQADEKYKLVVFVPVKDAGKVTNAIFAAGAGAIGNYSNCGFKTQGTGSFRPLEGSRPALGKKGKLENVAEVRFETIVPAEKLDTVIAAMKKAHPYEEPAYDCLKIFETSGKLGLGRIGKLKQPTQLKIIMQNIKKATGAKSFGVVGEEKRTIKRAAVCAGSCGKIINSVIADNCDLYLTGELKHHQALAAQEANMTCICLSHTVSERFILKKLAKQLQKQLKEVTIKVSTKDKDPFKWKNV